MKLLVFYPYIPWPLNRGTYHRTFHLLRELARIHEVDLVALAENGEGIEHKPVFEKFCHRVEFISFHHPEWQKLFPTRLLNPLPPNVAHWTMPHVEQALDKILAAGRYDAVHACDIVLAQYFMRKHRHIPLVIDRSRVDLQFQLMEHNRMNFSWRTKLLRGEGYLKLWLFERAVARRATVEMVCGPDDETFLRRYVKKKMPISVLVNGVDLNYFRPDASDDPRSAKPSLIFCGAMDYNPNIDALRWYFQEIHEPLRKLIPDLEVLIVGKQPASEVLAYGKNSNVIVTGGVPDVRPFYRRAWLQIVPLRIGGGTRLKIVESLAMGTPVVSTSIGAQGLNLRHGQEILLADRSEDFVRETARALRDLELRNNLERAGLDTARARFSWTMLGRQLIALYDQKFSSVPEFISATAHLDHGPVLHEPNH
ncbi:MAG: glycosyltransferase family 4 protein [Verrucomicrobiota bacterium]